MAPFYSLIPPEIDALSNSDAIDAYLYGAGEPAGVIAGLSASQLNQHPVANTWSIQQIIIHLMDTDLIASYRMKRIIAEDRPELDLYDEVAFSQRLHYDHLEARLACEIFHHNRVLTATLLRALSDSAFARVALHREMGLMALGRFLRLYVHHLNHHLRFAREKRRMIETGGS